MKKHLIIILYLIYSSFLFSQGNVSGNITFDNNKPLQGANIHWQNTQIGTVSDGKGNFSIPFSS